MTTDRPMKRRRLEDDLRDRLGDRSTIESDNEGSEVPEDSSPRNEPSELVFDPTVSVIIAKRMSLTDQNFSRAK